MMMVENKPAPVAPTTTPLNLLRERPENVWCPTKGAIVQTRAESKDSDKTWYLSRPRLTLEQSLMSLPGSPSLEYV